MPNRLLFIDDEKTLCEQLAAYFELKGYEVATAHDGATGIAHVQREKVDAVVLDLRLPDMSGLDVLEAIKRESPGTGVIMLTGFGDVETAVRALQLRGDHFLLKPVQLSALEAVVERVLAQYGREDALEYLQGRLTTLRGPTAVDKLVLPAEVVSKVQLLAQSPHTSVLILGETGTGKGVIANAIHLLSARGLHPLVDLNCAAMGGNLLESDLFGHERGAFTDAKAFKRGLLEIAHGGSVFLDEIGDMPLEVQAKLLKVLEERKFRRLGGTVQTEVDVRIMAATNSDLEKAVVSGKFRSDLYYRLNVMPIHVPPLREHRADVLPLAARFLEEFTAQARKRIRGCTPEAAAMLEAYSWPGNVRELRNVVERAVLLCSDEELKPAHLPENLRHKPKVAASIPPADLRLDAIEEKHIRRVLRMCGNNRTHAAAALGINRVTLIKKIRKYKLGQ